MTEEKNSKRTPAANNTEKTSKKGVPSLISKITEKINPKTEIKNLKTRLDKILNASSFNPSALEDTVAELKLAVAKSSKK